MKRVWITALSAMFMVTLFACKGKEEAKEKKEEEVTVTM